MLLVIIKILGLICSIICAVYNFKDANKTGGFWAIIYALIWLYLIYSET